MKEFETFLGERRRLSAERINTYMDSLLAPTRKGLSINGFIARGEGPELEFKSSIGWDHKLLAVNKVLEKVIAKTLAGFMNHKGGTLVVGVTDEGSVIGVEPDLATLRKSTRNGLSLHLTEMLGKHLGESVAALVDVTFADIDGKTVVIASAEPATQPVLTIRRQSAMCDPAHPRVCSTSRKRRNGSPSGGRRQHKVSGAVVRPIGLVALGLRPTPGQMTTHAVRVGRHACCD